MNNPQICRSKNPQLQQAAAPVQRGGTGQRRRKRMLCRRRAAIEPIIGHLKADCRLTRNWLRGSHGDQVNLMMATCAWNLRKWMIAFLVAENPFTHQAILIVLSARKLPHGTAFERLGDFSRLTNYETVQSFPVIIDSGGKLLAGNLEEKRLIGSRKCAIPVRIKTRIDHQ